MGIDAKRWKEIFADAPTRRFGGEVFYFVTAFSTKSGAEKAAKGMREAYVPERVRIAPRRRSLGHWVYPVYATAALSLLQARKQKAMRQDPLYRRFSREAQWQRRPGGEDYSVRVGGKVLTHRTAEGLFRKYKKSLGK